MLMILVLFVDFDEDFRKDTKLHTNHPSNSNQSIRTWPFINQIFWVTPLANETFTQSITHINTLTIIHKSKKSTNGSSSRNAHSWVIQFLKDILKFRQNNPTIAIKITNEDFRNIHENRNQTLDPFAFTTGKKNKQKHKTAKYNTNHFFVFL